MAVEQVNFGKAYLRLLNKCSDRCRHCYVNAGPDGKQMLSREQALRATSLWLTAWPHYQYLVLDGGDALMYPYLEDIIGLVKGSGIMLPLTYVRTSGLLFEKDFDGTIDRVKELSDKGLYGLTLSPGEFHSVKIETLDKIIEALSGFLFEIRFIQENDNGEVYAIERALKRCSKKEISLVEYEKCRCLKPSEVDLVVMENGNLAYCIFGSGVYGNLGLTDKEIKKRVSEDPIRRLLTDDRSGLAKLIEVALKIDPNILKVNPSVNPTLSELPKNCAACYRILTERKLINDRTLKREAERRLES